MNLEEKVKNLVITQLGVDASKVTNNSLFIDDLGADSLDTVELVMAFEEEFDIEIPDDDAQNIRSVADAIKYLGEHVSE
ncbi:MAG: acyl carrier protein [Candidatus Latescibacteria bacterium]|jgi:acyl carrier protein|nr:acyl carrier protein [Candidatus Latescibacterota bacterium]